MLDTSCITLLPTFPHLACRIQAVYIMENSVDLDLHFSNQNTGLKLSVSTKFCFSYFLTQTYVVGTQKNHLNETVLLSIQNIC